MRWTRLLLLIPLALAVWTPWSDHLRPDLWGIPFLVWFQFVIVLIGMAATGAVFLVEHWSIADRLRDEGVKLDSSH